MVKGYGLENIKGSNDLMNRLINQNHTLRVENKKLEEEIERLNNIIKANQYIEYDNNGGYEQWLNSEEFEELAEEYRKAFL